MEVTFSADVIRPERRQAHVRVGLRRRHRRRATGAKSTHTYPRRHYTVKVTAPTARGLGHGRGHGRGRHPPGNEAPTVEIAADPGTGTSPLTVQFSSQAIDPEGEDLQLRVGVRRRPASPPRGHRGPHLHRGRHVHRDVDGHRPARRQGHRDGPDHVRPRRRAAPPGGAQGRAAAPLRRRRLVRRQQAGQDHGRGVQPRAAWRSRSRPPRRCGARRRSPSRARSPRRSA